MQAINPIIISAILMLLVILVMFLLWLVMKLSSKLKQLSAQTEAANLVSEEFQHQVAHLEQLRGEDSQQLTAWQHEQEQVTEQLIHRTKQMQQQIKSLSESAEKLANMQPEDKLYSRAQKMVQLGADKDEIVRECQLPLAEVEILLSMHAKKTRAN